MRSNYKPRKHTTGDRLTCPRCGWEDKDSWVIDPDGGWDEMNCPECDARFEYAAFTEVYYRAELVDKEPADE